MAWVIGDDDRFMSRDEYEREFGSGRRFSQSTIGILQRAVERASSILQTGTRTSAGAPAIPGPRLGIAYDTGIDPDYGSIARNIVSPQRSSYGQTSIPERDSGPGIFIPPYRDVITPSPEEQRRLPFTEPAPPQDYGSIAGILPVYEPRQITPSPEEQRRLPFTEPAPMPGIASMPAAITPRTDELSRIAREEPARELPRIEPYTPRITPDIDEQASLPRIEPEPVRPAQLLGRDFWLRAGLDEQTADELASSEALVASAVSPELMADEGLRDRERLRSALPGILQHEALIGGSPGIGQPDAIRPGIAEHAALESNALQAASYDPMREYVYEPLFRKYNPLASSALRFEQVPVRPEGVENIGLEQIAASLPGLFGSEYRVIDPVMEYIRQEYGSPEVAQRAHRAMLLSEEINRELANHGDASAYLVNLFFTVLYEVGTWAQRNIGGPAAIFTVNNALEFMKPVADVTRQAVSDLASGRPPSLAVQPASQPDYISWSEAKAANEAFLNSDANWALKALYFTITDPLTYGTFAMKALQGAALGARLASLVDELPKAAQAIRAAEGALAAAGGTRAGAQIAGALMPTVKAAAITAKIIIDNGSPLVVLLMNATGEWLAASGILAEVAQHSPLGGALLGLGAPILVGGVGGGSYEVAKNIARTKAARSAIEDMLSGGGGNIRDLTLREALNDPALADSFVRRLTAAAIGAEIVVGETETLSALVNLYAKGQVDAKYVISVLKDSSALDRGIEGRPGFEDLDRLATIALDPASNLDDTARANLLIYEASARAARNTGNLSVPVRPKNIEEAKALGIPLNEDGSVNLAAAREVGRIVQTVLDNVVPTPVKAKPKKSKGGKVQDDLTGRPVGINEFTPELVAQLRSLLDFTDDPDLEARLDIEAGHSANIAVLEALQEASYRLLNETLFGNHIFRVGRFGNQSLMTEAELAGTAGAARASDVDSVFQEISLPEEYLYRDENGNVTGIRPPKIVLDDARRLIARREALREIFGFREVPARKNMSKGERQMLALLLDLIGIQAGRAEEVLRAPYVSGWGSQLNSPLLATAGYLEPPFRSVSMARAPLSHYGTESASSLASAVDAMSSKDELQAGIQVARMARYDSIEPGTPPLGSIAVDPYAAAAEAAQMYVLMMGRAGLDLSKELMYYGEGISGNFAAAYLISQFQKGRMLEHLDAFADMTASIMLAGTLWETARAASGSVSDIAVATIVANRVIDIIANSEFMAIKAEIKKHVKDMFMDRSWTNHLGSGEIEIARRMAVMDSNISMSAVENGRTKEVESFDSVESLATRHLLRKPESSSESALSKTGQIPSEFPNRTLGPGERSYSSLNEQQRAAEEQIGQVEKVVSENSQRAPANMLFTRVSRSFLDSARMVKRNVERLIAENRLPNMERRNVSSDWSPDRWRLLAEIIEEATADYENFINNMMSDLAYRSIAGAFVGAFGDIRRAMSDAAGNEAVFADAATFFGGMQPPLFLPFIMSALDRRLTPIILDQIAGKPDTPKTLVDYVELTAIRSALSDHDRLGIIAHALGLDPIVKQLGSLAYYMPIRPDVANLTSDSAHDFNQVAATYGWSRSAYTSARSPVQPSGTVSYSFHQTMSMLLQMVVRFRDDGNGGLVISAYDPETVVDLIATAYVGVMVHELTHSVHSFIPGAEVSAGHGIGFDKSEFLAMALFSDEILAIKEKLKSSLMEELGIYGGETSALERIIVDIFTRNSDRDISMGGYPFHANNAIQRAKAGLTDVSIQWQSPEWAKPGTPYSPGAAPYQTAPEAIRTAEDIGKARAPDGAKWSGRPPARAQQGVHASSQSIGFAERRAYEHRAYDSLVNDTPDESEYRSERLGNRIGESGPEQPGGRADRDYADRDAAGELLGRPDSEGREQGPREVFARGGEGSVRDLARGEEPGGTPVRRTDERAGDSLGAADGGPAPDRGVPAAGQSGRVLREGQADEAGRSAEADPVAAEAKAAGLPEGEARLVSRSMDELAEAFPEDHPFRAAARDVVRTFFAGSRSEMGSVPVETGAVIGIAAALGMYGGLTGEGDWDSERALKFFGGGLLGLAATTAGMRTYFWARGKPWKIFPDQEARILTASSETVRMYRETMRQFGIDLSEEDAVALVSLAYADINRERLARVRTIDERPMALYKRAKEWLEQFRESSKSDKFKELRRNKQDIIGQTEHLRENILRELEFLKPISRRLLKTASQRTAFLTIFENLKFGIDDVEDTTNRLMTFVDADQAKLLAVSLHATFNKLALVMVDAGLLPASVLTRDGNYMPHIWEALDLDERMYILAGGGGPMFSKALIERARHYKTFSEGFLEGRVNVDIDPVDLVARYVDVVLSRIQANQLMDMVRQIDGNAFILESDFNNLAKTEPSRRNEYVRIRSPLFRDRRDPAKMAELAELGKMLREVRTAQRRWARLAGMYGRRAQQMTNEMMRAEERIMKLEARMNDRLESLYARKQAAIELLEEVSGVGSKALDEYRARVAERAKAGNLSRDAASDMEAALRKLDKALKRIKKEVDILSDGRTALKEGRISDLAALVFDSIDDLHDKAAINRIIERFIKTVEAAEVRAAAADALEAARAAEAKARDALAEQGGRNVMKAERQVYNDPAWNRYVEMEGQIAEIEVMLDRLQRMRGVNQEMAAKYQRWREVAELRIASIKERLHGTPLQPGLIEAIRRDRQEMLLRREYAPLFKFLETSRFRQGAFLRRVSHLGMLMKNQVLAGPIDLFMIGVTASSQLFRALASGRDMPRHLGILKNAALSSMSILAGHPSAADAWYMSRVTRIEWARRSGMGVQKSAAEFYDRIAGERSAHTLFGTIPVIGRFYDAAVGRMERAQFEGFVRVVKVDSWWWGWQKKLFAEKNISKADFEKAYAKALEAARRVSDTPDLDDVTIAAWTMLVGEKSMRDAMDFAAKTQDLIFGGRNLKLSSLSPTAWDALHVALIAPNWFLTRTELFARALYDIAMLPVRAGESVVESAANTIDEMAGTGKYQRRTAHPFLMTDKHGQQWAVGAAFGGTVMLVTMTMALSAMAESIRNGQPSPPDWDYVEGELKRAFTDPTHFMEIRDPWTGQWWTPYTWQKDLFRVLVASYYAQRGEMDKAWETIGAYGKARTGVFPRIIQNIVINKNFAGRDITQSRPDQDFIGWLLDHLKNQALESLPQAASEILRASPYSGAVGYGESNPIYTVPNILGLGRGRVQTPLDKRFVEDLRAGKFEGSPRTYADLDALQKKEFIDRHPDVKEYLRESWIKQYADARKRIDAAMTKEAELVMVGINTDGRLYPFAEYRDNMALLSAERRGAGDIAFPQNYEPRTEDRKLIKSWYDLYDQAKIEGVGRIDPKRLEELQMKWVSEHSREEFEYVLRYDLVGRPRPMQEYLRALQVLKEIGAFTTPRWTGLKSGKTEDEILLYLDRARIAAGVNWEPGQELGMQAVASALYKILKEDGYTTEDAAIMRDAYIVMRDPNNPDYKKLREEHPGLFAWISRNYTYPEIVARMAFEPPEIRARVFGVNAQTAPGALTR